MNNSDLKKVGKVLRVIGHWARDLHKVTNSGVLYHYSVILLLECASTSKFVEVRYFIVGTSNFDIFQNILMDSNFAVLNLKHPAFSNIAELKLQTLKDVIPEFYQTPIPIDTRGWSRIV